MATARPAAGFLERLFGRRSEPERPEVELPRVPTADDLLAALDRVEAMVAGGAVPAVVASRVDPGVPHRARHHPPPGRASARAARRRTR